MVDNKACIMVPWFSPKQWLRIIPSILWYEDEQIYLIDHQKTNEPSINIYVHLVNEL